LCQRGLCWVPQRSGKRRSESCVSGRIATFFRTVPHGGSICCLTGDKGRCHRRALVAVAKNASWLVVVIRSRYTHPAGIHRGCRSLPRRPLTRVDIEGFAGTITKWVQLIDEGELEAGPVLRSELAGASPFSKWCSEGSRRCQSATMSSSLSTAAWEVTDGVLGLRELGSPQGRYPSR
jgi:hypothetical protein